MSHVLESHVLALGDTVLYLKTRCRLSLKMTGDEKDGRTDVEDTSKLALGLGSISLCDMQWRSRVE